MKKLLFAILFLIPFVSNAQINVDLNRTFSIAEKLRIVSNMNYTASEITTLYKVLDNEKILWKERESYISLFNKQIKREPLTLEEKNFIFSRVASKNGRDLIVYFSLKKLNE